ncbi:MAG: DUF2156 domain-containing protein [Clostridia bacterium]|nr:DUF2156 domain-containing protein [Clostridia bacterium]
MSIDTKIEGKRLLDFKSIEPRDREQYNKHLFKSGVRGSEASFGNMFLWGNQKINVTDEGVYILATFGNHVFYPFPIGDGDTKTYVETIIADAQARGLHCIINGITRDRLEEMKALFPNMFEYNERRSFFDYVYNIEDLATLEGKKYSKKRNHLNRFKDLCPNYSVEEISQENIHRVREMADGWYISRETDNPELDFTMEKKALYGALDNYIELGLEGIMIIFEDEVIAFTIGNRLSFNTFDVQFEKASGKIQGSYVAVNNEFAKHLLTKHPELEYLDREEDMGIEGLRKAKESYYPALLIEKHRACLIKCPCGKDMDNI